MNKNLILVWLVGLSIITALIFVPLHAGGEEVSDSDSFVEEVAETDTLSEQEQEMYDEMVRIAYIEDREEWFVEYKALFDKYPEYLAEQETIYDVYSPEELDKLFKITEAEATGGTFMDKVNVCVTIFNRINSEDFGDTIDDILTPDQFQPLSDGRWQTVEVAESTILACEYAYIFGIIEHDALYFDATDGNSWAHRNLEEVEVNGDNAHRFYK